MKALYAAWKGVAEDEAGIFWATSSDGLTWSPQQQLQGSSTSHGPTLAVFDGRLYMFWKGFDDDPNIWWSVTVDGKHWTQQQIAPGPDTPYRFETNETPAACTFNGSLQLFWKGAKDLGIYHARAARTVLNGQEHLAWDPQSFRRLESHYGPTRQENLILTDNAPAVAARSRLTLAGKNGNNTGIFVWPAGGGDAFDIDTLAEIPSVGTDNGPAIIGDPTTLALDPGQPARGADNWFVFWRGSDNDQGIWSSHGEGSSWSAQAKVPNVGTSHRPALAWWGANVYALWKGIDDDAGVYSASFSPSSITDWRDPTNGQPIQPGQHLIPNIGTSHRPALATFEPPLHMPGRPIGQGERATRTG